MVVKPIALVAVAALVVVAAGAGAYLAVRDNRVAVNTAETLVNLPESAPLAQPAELDVPAEGEAVDVTEQIIGSDADTEANNEEGDPAPGAARPEPPETTRSRTTQPPPAAQRASRIDETRPTAGASESLGTATPPSATESSRRPSAPRSGASNLPEAPGWKRLSEPWPSRGADREDSSRPEQVSLRNVDSGTLGSTLPPEEPPPVFEELVISADSVIGLQVDTPVSTDTAEIEDDVEARVTRDVMVDDRVAIPAGTRVLGSVVLVERAGQIKGASRLGVRFHTVVLDDVFEVPVVTETVYREGRGRGGESAAKIGGAAVGGAILGAIFGGGRGAAIGGAAGAAGGTAAAMAGDGEAATLAAGATLTVRLSSPATVTVEP